LDNIDFKVGNGTDIASKWKIQKQLWHCFLFWFVCWLVLNKSEAYDTTTVLTGL